MVPNLSKTARGVSPVRLPILLLIFLLEGQTIPMGCSEQRPRRERKTLDKALRKKHVAVTSAPEAHRSAS